MIYNFDILCDRDLKEEYADECEPVFDVLNQNEFPGTIIDDKLSIIK